MEISRRDVADDTRGQGRLVTLTMPQAITAGMAVTSHDPTVLNTATFDNIATTITTPPVQNLLVNGGFEESIVPNTGPGWVSDTFRQTPAHSETADPHSGAKNGACRTTSRDCGIYQEFTTPSGNNYLFSAYASADHPGAWIGANINGTTYNAQPIAVGGYQTYTLGLFAQHPGDVVRVWLQPAAAGFVVVDDATLSVNRSALSESREAAPGQRKCASARHPEHAFSCRLFQQPVHRLSVRLKRRLPCRHQPRQRQRNLSPKRLLNPDVTSLLQPRQMTR